MKSAKVLNPIELLTLIQHEVVMSEYTNVLIYMCTNVEDREHFVNICRCNDGVQDTILSLKNHQYPKFVLQVDLTNT